jgi:hypothetical protein
VYEKDDEESIWVYIFYYITLYYIIYIYIYITYKVCEKDNEESIWAIKKIKLDGDDDMRACVLNEIELLVALRDESSIIHMKDYEVCAHTQTPLCIVCVCVCVFDTHTHYIQTHTQT